MDDLRLLVIVWVVIFAVPVAWLATERGRPAFPWLVLGAFYGPFALLMVGLAPVSDSGAFGRCPECQEVIRMAATTCPHCGTDLGEDEDDRNDETALGRGDGGGRPA